MLFHNYVESMQSTCLSIYRLYPKTSGSRLFLARQKNAIIGGISVKVYSKKSNTSSPTQYYELGHFCVCEDVRQKGIGKALISSLMEYCKILKISTLQLTVLDDLEAAKRVYEQNGFQRTKETALSDTCKIISYEFHFK